MLSIELISQKPVLKLSISQFFWQISFFVIFLCYIVNPIFGSSCCHGNLFRNFKNYYFVFVLQMYIMSNMFKIINILSCWKEIVCFEYALFDEYAIFVKSLMV